MTLADSDGEFADVADPFVRAKLGKNPRVREAIQAFDRLVGNPADQSSHLDGALIRLAGSAGRSITQEVSRAVYEQGQHVGLAHISRWHDYKRCWAIFGEVATVVDQIVPLSPSDPEHRTAVRMAAELHGLPLPSEWL